MFDYLIVGAGLFGSVFAQQAVADGKTVLVIDKRDHVGGNVYTKDIDGIQVHKYGAHIFHTNNADTWEYVQKFAEFNRFTNSPIANYRGELYSLPFNMLTFNRMWGVVYPYEVMAKIERQRAEISREPKNLEEQAISLVGRDVYEKLVKGYTEKQWGRKCTELPPFIIKRLPVRFTYDNNYFDARYQGIPICGYTKMIERMLQGAVVDVGCDYLKDKERYDAIARKVVYTGPLDAYFGNVLGELEYRSLRFETDSLMANNYQGVAVMNFTDFETPWTRIIEHKWFNFGKDENGKEITHRTVITREYSTEWQTGFEPYYPINNERNELLAAQYKEMAKKERNVLFGGRLGEYRYYDMDRVIENAIALYKAQKDR